MGSISIFKLVLFTVLCCTPSIYLIVSAQPIISWVGRVYAIQCAMRAPTTFWIFLQVTFRDARRLESFADVAVGVESRLSFDPVSDSEKRPEEGQGAKWSKDPWWVLNFREKATILLKTNSFLVQDFFELVRGWWFVLDNDKTVLNVIKLFCR